MAVVPYSRQTHVDGPAGTPATAARLNVIEAGINDVSFAPCVRVYHASAQSILNNTLTVLAFNSEQWDQAGNAADTMHDTATNNSRLTCRYAGVYDIKASISFDDTANTGGMRQMLIRLNGTTYLVADARAWSTASETMIAVSTQYKLAVNDYVEVVVAQTSGAAKNVISSTNYSPFFMMHRVG